MQDNNKTLIKTVKTPLKLSETLSKTRTRSYLQENLQMRRVYVGVARWYFERGTRCVKKGFKG